MAGGRPRIEHLVWDDETRSPGAAEAASHPAAAPPGSADDGAPVKAGRDRRWTPGASPARARVGRRAGAAPVDGEGAAGRVAAGPGDARREAMALRAARAGDGLLRTGATVGSFTAAGRVCGYAREIAVAAVLGAGPAADAFFLALRVPGFVRQLFGGRGLGAVFIPMFTRRLSRAGASRARSFAGEVVSFAAVAIAALTVLLELAAPWLVHLLAPGFTGEDGQAELTATLVRIMLPCVLFASLAQLLGGMLNGLGRFAAASAMPVVFNLAVLAVLAALATRLSAPAHALAWGIAAAGAAQLLFVGVCCRRAGMMPGPVRPTRRVRRLLRRGAPAVAQVGASQAVLVVDLALATLLAGGSVSFVHYAGRVARLLPSVAGAAAATVLLPHLARHGGREASATDGATNRTLEAVLLLGVPGAVALTVIAEPVVAGLLQRGAFGAHAVAPTAAVLAAYAGAVPAWMLLRSLGAVCFARGDTATPMVAALGAVSVNLVLSLVLMGPLGAVGIALATGVAAWMQSGILAVALVRRRAFVPDRRLYWKVGACAVASALMAGVLWLVRLGLGGYTDAGGFERVVGLVALVAAGLACFAAAALATGAVRWREFRPRAPLGK